jgi:hypothetical protein
VSDRCLLLRLVGDRQASEGEEVSGNRLSVAIHLVIYVAIALDLIGDVAVIDKAGGLRTLEVAERPLCRLEMCIRQVGVELRMRDPAVFKASHT